MITKKDFPNKLYVWVDEAGDERILIAEIMPEECASLTEDKLVGIYSLEKVGKVTTSIAIS